MMTGIAFLVILISLFDIKEHGASAHEHEPGMERFSKASVIYIGPSSPILLYYYSLPTAVEHWVGNFCWDSKLSKCLKQIPNPDLLILGFDSAFPKRQPEMDMLQNVKLPIACIINKEYSELDEKLQVMKNELGCTSGFTVHHNFSQYQEKIDIPFYRIPFAAQISTFAGPRSPACVGESHHHCISLSDPSLEVNQTVNYKYDLGYTGVVRKLQPGNWRSRIITVFPNLKSHNISIYTGEVRIFPEFIFYGGNIPTIDYVKILHSTKMWISTLSPASIVGTRYFEVMASGTTLILTPNSDLLVELFGVSGLHYVGFDDEEELLGIVQYYISHEDERQQIVERAQKHIIEHHTWLVRAYHLLEHAGI